MISESEERDPDVDSDESENDELTPDYLLALRLREALAAFSARQTEILRLAEFMEERSTEIDNATERAKEIISAQIGDINEDVVDRLVQVFTTLTDSDLGEDDLSPEDRQSAIVRAFADVTASLPDELTAPYLEGALRAIQAPPGVDLLRSSLLVTLVGELEMLVNVIARAAVERQPSSLDESGRQFTWAEISAYESLDDLRDHVVDRAIEEVFRGSLTDWMEFFTKRFKMAPIKAAQSFSAQESIQRRHCIVHNAGMVSSLYLERLRGNGLDLEVGDDLEVTPEYLRQAADTLYLVAYSLCWAVGFKLIREDDAKEELTSMLANRVYYLLQDRRFSLVRQIGQEVPYDKIDGLASFVIKVNFWLAYKLDGKFEKIRRDVEMLDVTTRSRQFRLAKLALLGQDEEAYDLAQAMIRDEELRPEFLFTWPLLAGAREYARKKSEASAVDENTGDQLESEVTNGEDAPS